MLIRLRMTLITNALNPLIVIQKKVGLMKWMTRRCRILVRMTIVRMFPMTEYYIVEFTPKQAFLEIVVMVMYQIVDFNKPFI